MRYFPGSRLINSVTTMLAMPLSPKKALYAFLYIETRGLSCNAISQVQSKGHKNRKLRYFG